MSSVEDARFAPSVVVQALDMIQSAVGHTPRSSRYCSGAPQLINKEVAKSSLKVHPRRCFFLQLIQSGFQRAPCFLMTRCSS